MLRKRLGLAALLCVVALHNSAAAWDKGEPTDIGETTIASRLQGTWVIESLEVMGMKIDAPPGQQVLFTFKGDKVVVEQGPQREEIPYKLDETKTPKEIDLVNPNGQGKERIKGIYQLEGDRLKVAFNENQPDGPRPTAFNGKTVAIAVLKRKK